jgi:hypothetical protein
MTLLKRCVVCSALGISLLSMTACTKHEIEVKPVEIKPIHITIDINVRIDKALDDFFGDLDEAQTE